MTSKIIFGKKNIAKLLWRGEWDSHLGSNSGVVWQVGAASAHSLLVPTRARWSAWCAQNCSATVVYMYMRTRSMDFECLGSQSACRMCQSPPIASNNSAFGPVMPTVQLDAKPVLLSTYINSINRTMLNHPRYSAIHWSVAGYEPLQQRRCKVTSPPVDSSYQRLYSSCCSRLLCVDGRAG